MAKEIVEIAIEGFSGPLDLLCHLVENRQMQASKIKMTQLVRIYGAYLSKTQKASVDTLAEFFFMMARLLLQKTLSLLPSPESEGSFEEDTGVDEPGMSEEELLERLARYRPYRSATTWLEERKARQDRYHRRIVPEEEVYQGEPIYDIGDLYFLSRIWWGLLEKKLARSSLLGSGSGDSSDFGDFEEWDGMPEALPEESQIQGRIAELEEKLAASSQLSLNALWALSPTVKVLVVTLLAVLEMCRMGKVSIEQDALFSDVRILAKGS